MSTPKIDTKRKLKISIATPIIPSIDETYEFYMDHLVEFNQQPP